ncbi:endolytic transglycosylase MltG [uncultured Jatrophihabitans sp.]|uniref:endolytic transglycosylase MltG n=1 Tax=uncultured Jatrophihabitans sp. TaxID=1610747 RepID=UPI0035CAFBED
MRQRDREASAYADDAYASPDAPAYGHGFADGRFDDDAEGRFDGDAHGSHDDHDGDGLFHDTLLGDYDADDGDDGPLPRVTRVSRRERAARATGPAATRSERRAHARRRQNRRFFVILAVLVVALVAVATWLVVLPVYHYLEPDDYSGNGGKPVLVTVQADDDATDIGNTLHARGVVASTRAFTDAAGDNAKSQNIQPGSYRLRAHLPATKALALLLTPSARVNSDVVVFEGATVVDVKQRLVAKPCTASSPADATCGPGLDAAAVARAFRSTRGLGMPTDYTVNGKTPASVEGFLYPATYTVAGRTAPSAVLQQMISNFTDVARTTDFTASARALSLTPYQELIVASIAEKEAKFAADYPRVARVILNRLAAHKPLQIDATSAYAAKLKGLDPAKVIYSQINSPYNTYTHVGLPPTPIASPGTAAMNGAAHPAAGNALYYVNGDAAGHLVFTNDENVFARAVATCRAHGWGCG